MEIKRGMENICKVYIIAKYAITRDYRMRKLQAMEGNDIHPLNSMNEMCMRYFQRAMNKTFTRQKGFP